MFGRSWQFHRAVCNRKVSKVEHLTTASMMGQCESYPSKRIVTLWHMLKRPWLNLSGPGGDDDPAHQPTFKMANYPSETMANVASETMANVAVFHWGLIWAHYDALEPVYQLHRDGFEIRRGRT